MSATVPVPVARLAVVGAGLVGGSVALAARDAGVPDVRLTDASAGVRDRARDLALATTVPDTLAATVAEAEVVVVAVPPSAVADVVAAVADAAPPEAVITDVAGLKAGVVADSVARLAAAGRDPGRYVGGHPMAGSERSGPEAADARLFQGATWILTPTDRTADAALGRASALVAALGGRVLVLPPARHDALVTTVSHLPQLVASTLADVAADELADAGDALLAVIGPGFRDTTRIAASDATLWTEVVAANAPAIAAALGTFAGRLEALRAAVAAGDLGAVRALLERAGRARRRMVPKADLDDVVDLVVPLLDRPGALAAATGALGEAGVNVEDLAMRHATHADRGALIVRVRAGSRARAVAALAAAGHTVVEEDAS